MKKCNACGVLVDEQAKTCPMCSSSDFTEATATAQQTQPTNPVQAYPPVTDPVYSPQSVSVNEQENQGHGNILAGIVGAFLFSIIGGLLYFVIYQAGMIAGICGLVIFVLANFGYGLFARTKNKASMVALIVSIITMIVMIFLAEYVCVSYEIFRVFEDQNITIFDAIKVTPEFLAEPEIGDAVMGDLAFAYIFGFAATIGNIVNIVKARKKKQAANQ